MGVHGVSPLDFHGDSYMELGLKGRKGIDNPSCLMQNRIESLTENPA